MLVYIGENHTEALRNKLQGLSAPFTRFPLARGPFLRHNVLLS